MRKFMSAAWLGTGLLAVAITLSSTGCPGNRATLRVDNNTSKAIDGIYCTPTSDDSWGPNLINSTIAAGTTRDIGGFSPDQYDILAVFTDDTEAEISNVAFVAGETYTWNVLLSLPSGKEGGSIVIGDPDDAAEVRMKSGR